MHLIARKVSILVLSVSLIGLSSLACSSEVVKEVPVEAEKVVEVVKEVPVIVRKEKGFFEELFPKKIFD